MIFVAVDTTWAQQSQDMQRAGLGLGLATRTDQDFIGLEVAFVDRFGDSGEILVNNSTSPEVHVTDFRVTHLPYW